MQQNDETLRKRLQLASPDFDDIKKSLRTYLEQQDSLKDYDFDGATLTTILNVLAYNTHMNAFFMNMSHNESFLSTAVIRDSIVKRAKDMGYVPRSTRSAAARLRITFNLGDAAATTQRVVIPKYTVFKAETLDKINNFFFYTTQAYEVEKSARGDFTTEIDVFEGRLFTHRFDITVDNNRKITIPNPDVDTRFLEVSVLETDISSVTPQKYAQYFTISGVTEKTRAYWVYEGENLLHDIEFGDGVIGKPLAPGYRVNVSYLISSGPLANNCGVFTYGSEYPDDVQSVSVTTVTKAKGGAEIESIDSIKFSAAKYYAAQNRATTAQDYRTILLREYSNIDDINVWGGEKANPPQYGAVFMAIKPAVGTILSTREKERIINEILSKYMVLSVTPIIVDPDYTFVDIAANVKYNLRETTLTPAGIANQVRTAVLNHINTSVAKFGRGLLNSPLLRVIDSANPAIVNSTVTLRLVKRYQSISIGVQEEEIVLNFKHAFVNGTFVSGRFKYGGYENCFFQQNAVNPTQIDLMTLNAAGNSVALFLAVGTANSTNGTVRINKIQIDWPAVPQVDSITGERFISFSVIPSDLDIEPSTNTIITADSNSINVTADGI